jgi:multidrug resistance efflux pump
MPQQEERILPQAMTAADLVERLVGFEGPPQEFLRHLVTVQCRLANAQAGAILRPAAQGEMQVLVSEPPVPPEGPMPAWLSQSAQAAAAVMQAGKTGLFPVHDPSGLYGEEPRHWLIAMPIRQAGRGEMRGAAAFLVNSRDTQDLHDRQERLELSSSLLALYEMQLSSQLRQADMRRLRDALEVVSATSQHDRLVALAVGVCNEFASRWTCQRVSVGFLRGRGIRLAAISHTENFSRKMQLVQDVESAMEECLDQDVEVFHPSGPEATFVSRAAARLSERHGPMQICSFPLRHAGKVVGVLTAERSREKPFDVPTLESMRLAADLVTARLANLHEQDRWFGAKAAAGVRKLAAGAVGPKHTWIKLAVIAGFALLAFLIFFKGLYSVESPMTVQAMQHRVINAPFQGLLKEVNVDLGKAVRQGEVLGSFDTDELQKKMIAAKTDRDRFSKKADEDMAAAKNAEAQQDRLQADQAQQQIELLERQIASAQLLAPFDGYVISGEINKLRGNTFAIGQPLFEVAPMTELRAELRVDERDIHEVMLGQEGELATTGHPEVRLGFKVEAISPVAETVEGKNVFKVRVRLQLGESLDKAMYWLRPGMEGLAKVHVDRRRYAWIWTHRAVEWVHLRLWQYGLIN